MDGAVRTMTMTMVRSSAVARGDGGALRRCARRVGAPTRMTVMMAGVGASDGDGADEKKKEDSAAREGEIKKALDAIMASGGTLTGKVEVVNRGGLVLRAQKGKFRAFLPKSQMRSSRLKGDLNAQGNAQEMDETKILEAQIGKLIDVKLMDVTPKKIVVSERALFQ